MHIFSQPVGPTTQPKYLEIPSDLHIIFVSQIFEMAAHKVNFITGNANKLREVKAILEPEIEVTSKSIDLEEVQGTLEEVTESKCRRAAELV